MKRVNVKYFCPWILQEGWHAQSSAGVQDVAGSWSFHLDWWPKGLSPCEQVIMPPSWWPEGVSPIFCHHVTLVKTIYMGHHQLTSWSSHLGDDQRGDHWSGTRNPQKSRHFFKFLKSAIPKNIFGTLRNLEKDLAQMSNFYAHFNFRPGHFSVHGCRLFGAWGG